LSIDVREYENEISQLNSIDEDEIIKFRLFAEDNEEKAEKVVDIIENRILTADFDAKLPALYVMDNIIKSLGNLWINLFANKVVYVFEETFKASVSMYPPLVGPLINLANTWDVTFPPAVFQQIMNVISKYNNFNNYNSESSHSFHGERNHRHRSSSPDSDYSSRSSSPSSSSGKRLPHSRSYHNKRSPSNSHHRKNNRSSYYSSNIKMNQYNSVNNNNNSVSSSNLIPNVFVYNNNPNSSTDVDVNNFSFSLNSDFNINDLLSHPNMMNSEFLNQLPRDQLELLLNYLHVFFLLLLFSFFLFFF
jgi:hypothetical protein